MGREEEEDGNKAMKWNLGGVGGVLCRWHVDVKCNSCDVAHHPMDFLCITSLIGILWTLSMHIFDTAPIFGFAMASYNQ
jgi:hypothetical protein